MDITCNGEQMAVKQTATLNDLVLSLGLNPQTLVAELNGRIVEYNDFATHPLRENDRIELIRFVGGG
ncbi:MAG: sulfur carrier protein ThiS [Desulfobulbaceae bacterium]|jgi:thiamine biosynthesis protein ThiS|nr:sulfur carrier protein ThiS [Desulfobulbaceae bacterium]MDY0349727.1 sulfur carrier protein ThiS [Desulfobulbaceae bacterium]